DAVTVVGGAQGSGTDVLSGDMSGSGTGQNDPMIPTLVEPMTDGGALQGTTGRDLFQIGQSDIMATIQDFTVGEDQILVGSGQGSNSLSILQVGNNALIGDRATGAVFAQVGGASAQALIASADETFQTTA
ncbi:MAG: hypothetical protein WBA10_06410, partial [Elainellaceae cyanobacterium]